MDLEERGATDVTGAKDPDERDRRNWQLSTERAVNTRRRLQEVLKLTDALKAQIDRLATAIGDTL